MANPALPPDASVAGPAVPVVPSQVQDGLPSPPFFTVAGVGNFRTIGGYRSSTDPPRVVRRDLIYRSALPSRIEEPGIETLTHELGVKTIFDLRSTVESQQLSSSMPHTAIPGVSVISVPVFPDIEWTEPTRMQESWKLYTDPIDKVLGYSKGLVQGYQRIASVAGPVYASILRHLLSFDGRQEGRGAIVVHCTAGKDRTGVFTALVLKLCGVDHATIADEYSLTEQGMGAWKEVILQRLLAEAKYNTQKNTEDQQRARRAEAERMMSARKENMAAFLHWLDDAHGGAEGYWRNTAGLTAEELDRIRELLLVKAE